MTRPLVTLCVPTIGRTDYLPDIRASIAAQTFTDFEVLVLDNASPPAAAAMFAEWEKSDPRIVVKRVDTRISLFENHRRGVLASRGKYVTFFHDDDAYNPTYLAAQVRALEAHPTAGFSGSNWDFIDESGNVTEHRRWIAADGLWRGRDYIRRLMRSGRNPIPYPGVMYRRETLDDFDTTISAHYGDFVILMRMAEKCDVAVIAEPLLRIRRHAEQCSQEVPLSKGVCMRTETLNRYCEELALRLPNDRQFVDELRTSVARAHRRGLVWGWISSPDEHEAEACLDNLGASALDSGVRLVLNRAQSLGISPAVRRKYLLGVARRIGSALRM